MQDFSQEQNVPFSFGQTDDIEVDLASPWARMGAVLLNYVIYVLLGVVFGVLSAALGAGGIAVGLLVILVFFIWQLVEYSKHGQTIGKKIVGVRVIKEDGGNPGFVGAVLLREVVYNIALSVLGLLITVPLGLHQVAVAEEVTMGDVVNMIISFTASLVCVVMMFAVRDRRTLQDMLAKTVVIKLPK